LPTLDTRNATELTFGFDLRLQGTGSLQVLPVGKTSRVSLAANWPHPSFIGNFLPAKREIMIKVSAPIGRPRFSPPTCKKR
jgi:inner membrane protein